MSVSSNYGALVAGESLVNDDVGSAGVFPAEWVDVIYNVARRSDTWTAHN